MDRATVVAKCLLSESLRVSASLRALRPGVPVGMQADANDSYDATPATKFSRSMIRRSCFDVWKQIA